MRWWGLPLVLVAWLASCWACAWMLKDCPPCGCAPCDCNVEKYLSSAWEEVAHRTVEKSVQCTRQLEQCCTGTPPGVVARHGDNGRGQPQTEQPSGRTAVAPVISGGGE